MIKRITATLLACLLILSVSIPASASQPEVASPRYVNTSRASVYLSISSSGVATVSVQCVGYSFATSITAKTYLERKVGSSWERVDIETTDDVWTDTTSSTLLIKSHTHTLVVKGEYRATTEFTVTGSSQNETFSLSETRTYS